MEVGVNLSPRLAGERGAGRWGCACGLLSFPLCSLCPTTAGRCTFFTRTLRRDALSCLVGSLFTSLFSLPPLSSLLLLVATFLLGGLADVSEEDEDELSLCSLSGDTSGGRGLNDILSSRLLFFPFKERT